MDPKEKGPEASGPCSAELCCCLLEAATSPFSSERPSSLQLSWLRSSSIDSPLTSKFCDLEKIAA
jgi:hypothetical protein